jgi:hypothetical protein
MAELPKKEPEASSAFLIFGQGRKEARLWTKEHKREKRQSKGRTFQIYHVYLRGSGFLEPSFREGGGNEVFEEDNHVFNDNGVDIGSAGSRKQGQRWS